MFCAIRKTSKFIFFIIFIFAPALCCCSCASKSVSQNSDNKALYEKNSDAIHIAVNSSLEPFGYMGDNEELLGFDIALAMKIAEEMDRTPIFHNMNRDSIFGALNSGIAEFAVSTLESTNESKQIVDFSETYITLSSSIVTSVYNTESNHVSTLKNATAVGAVCGTHSEKFLTNILGLSNLVFYKDEKDAVSAILNQEVDALFIDDYIADKIIQINTNLHISDTDINQIKYAIAVPKGNSDILKTINEKIHRFKTNGTLYNLRDAYLGNNRDMRKVFDNELKTMQSK